MERQKLIERLKTQIPVAESMGEYIKISPENARLFLELLEKEEWKAYIKKGLGNKADEIEPGDHFITT